LAAGDDGALTTVVARATAGTGTRVRTVVAGLGGRPITGQRLHALLDRAEAGRLDLRTFLDLDDQLVQREQHRGEVEQEVAP
jgi:pyruvate ferredoxin oxidoreductase alpha subunit